MLPPRTEAMTEKMRRFTDAGRYPQDDDIDFLPDGHVYLYQGTRQLLPVSALIAYFFEPFDAQRAAEQQFVRYGIPVEQSLEKWKRIGRMASEVGTFVHEQTENYFQNGVFLDSYDFQYGGTTEHISIAREREQFFRFITDYNIHPYRQEWPVYDTELNIAGTIDLVCQNDDGTFTIFDWKRSRKVCDAEGNPLVTPFGNKKASHGLDLPDTSYYHYCMQQNLYRYMLQRNYGIRVTSLNLVVLCPDYARYHLVGVPLMDGLMERLTTICREEQLGHHLL